MDSHLVLNHSTDLQSVVSLLSDSNSFYGACFDMSAEKCNKVLSCEILTQLKSTKKPTKRVTYSSSSSVSNPLNIIRANPGVATSLFVLSSFE